MRKIITCSNCGKIEEHQAFGLCRKCYRNLPNQKIKAKEYYKKWYKENRYTPKITICQSCGINKPHAKGLCQSCYYKKYIQTKPISENKSCTVYLGCHIAEQVLSKIFKNVEIMPYGNPGYDFICDKGYVDVKASCRCKNDDWSDRWFFNIKKNKITNYFLLLAFDNRTNLNPEYLWLIPGNNINNKQSISIFESTISKWNNYKLDIDKIVKCCDILKGDLK